MGDFYFLYDFLINLIDINIGFILGLYATEYINLLSEFIMLSLKNWYNGIYQYLKLLNILCIYYLYNY